MIELNLGFDGGMEQYFLVTVTDRTSGEVAYNHTTTKLDLLVTNLSAGSSYLVQKNNCQKQTQNKTNKKLIICAAK